MAIFFLVFLRFPCIFFISTLIMWPFVSPMTTPAATSTIGRRLPTCSANPLLPLQRCRMALIRREDDHRLRRVTVS